MSPAGDKARPTLRYEVGADDLKPATALQMRQGARDAGQTIPNLVILAVAAIYVAAVKLLAPALFPRLPAHSYDLAVVTGLAGILLGWLAQWIVGWAGARRALKAHEARAVEGVGEIETTIAPEGVLTRTARAEARMSWRGVDRVERLPTGLALWTQGGDVMVIPARAFADESAMAACHALIERRIAGARA